MHACRESRRQALYEQVFYNSPSDPPEERYAWINFDMDMIDLYHGSIDRLDHLKHRIRRLKMERCHNDQYWHYTESPNMVWFDKLQVCHVVARRSLWAWNQVWKDVPWTCPKENLKFIDKQTGQMMGGDELDEMVEQEYAEIERHEEAAEWNSRINELFA